MSAVVTIAAAAVIAAAAPEFAVLTAAAESVVEFALESAGKSALGVVLSRGRTLQMILGDDTYFHPILPLLRRTLQRGYLAAELEE